MSFGLANEIREVMLVCVQATNIMHISIKAIMGVFFLMTTPLISDPDSGGQSEMNAQALLMLETVDAGLNKVYKAILEERKNDVGSVGKIKQEQREWLKRMEAELHEAFPLKKGENPLELYGSSYPAEYSEIRSQHILDRIKELQKLGGKSAFNLNEFYANHESMQEVADTESVLDPSNNSKPVEQSAVEKKNPIMFSGMWIAKYVNGSQVVEKYENVSKRPIKAFKVTVVSVDDFGEVKHSFETLFDSNTIFNAGGDRAAKHVIKPGESIYIQTFRIDWESTITASAVNPLLEGEKVRREKDLPADIQVDLEKLRFKVDKIAYAD